MPRCGERRPPRHGSHGGQRVPRRCGSQASARPLGGSGWGDNRDGHACSVERRVIRRGFAAAAVLMPSAPRVASVLVLGAAALTVGAASVAGVADAASTATVRIKDIDFSPHTLIVK